MPEYVLDTHACIHALAAPDKLGRRARKALERADQRGERVWVAAAVMAEIVLLKELGRTEIGLPTLREAFETTCWRFLALDLDQLDEFASLGTIRDPFDRLIVAAARRTGAKLISRDERLADSGLVGLVWG
ncbi:MAG TPA: type II toxin-antitoxin system VapC family toxin [Longimicrobiales bacterium]|nr:type II toxin-antitoxin system VapC family toxin [Longimicrobiales bacterium]